MDIVVWHEFQKKSPDEIIGAFPQLSHAEIHAALAYYFDHREEIAALLEQDRLMDEYGKTQPSRLKDYLAAIAVLAAQGGE